MSPKSILSIRYLSLVLIGILVISCEPQKLKVNFKISVKDNQGKFVNSANVKINQKKIGKTDSNGNFFYSNEFSQGSTINIKIAKDSDEYYYAPYFDSFPISNKSPQTISVNATLYFVPKPTRDDLKMIADEDKQSNTDKSEIIVTSKQPKQDNKKKEVIKNSTFLHSNPKNENKIIEKNENFSSEKKISSKIQPTPPQKSIDKIKPSSPEVVLNKIIDDKYSDLTPKSASYPKFSHQNKGETYYTIHTTSQNKPLAGVRIYYGEENKRRLKSACLTNKRGRCLLKFPKKPSAPLTFVASKKGYKTITNRIQIKHKGNLRLKLFKGETIDIFTITKKYNYIQGLANIDVLAQGQKVGKTDKFGHFSYFYRGKKNELLEIALQSPSHLPENYSTDFIVSGPMNLVRYFTPQNPPKANIVLLKSRPSGEASAKDIAAFNGDFDRLLHKAVRKMIFKSKMYNEVPLSFLQKFLEKENLTINELMHKGWNNEDIKAKVDAIILPTLIIRDQKTLELSFIDSRGKVLAAAKERLSAIRDKNSILQAVNIISNRINKAYPFEGAIIKTDNNSLEINIGHSSDISLATGDLLEVYGIQYDKLGKKQTHKKIALATIKEVLNDSSLITIKKLEPRAAITKGDLVILKARGTTSKKSSQIRILGIQKGVSKPIHQANLYFNDVWLGATDQNGYIFLSKNRIKGKGLLRVVKHGYRDFSREFHTTSFNKVEIKLIRETAFVRIESEPSGAIVKIDGRKIGRTPLSSPIPVPSGFVKISLEGSPLYKKFQTIFDLDQGTLELTGSRKVVLEKDYRMLAHKQLKEGNLHQGLAKLQAIPKDHTDYLLAQHEIGEIFLTKLNNPAQAAYAFSNVTSSPKVKSFMDKRFIGSHINEGIALFLTAEKLEATDQNTAKAHYQKAVETLNNVTPYLRFVPKNQHQRALHNVGYHKALSLHRIWTLTKSSPYLTQANQAWHNYIESHTDNKQKRGGDEASYLINAEIYYKQTKAALRQIEQNTEQI